MNQLQKLFSWLKHAAAHSPKSHTVDGRQLRLVAYPVIYGGFLHPRWLFVISSPQQHHQHCSLFVGCLSLSNAKACGLQPLLHRFVVQPFTNALVSSVAPIHRPRRGELLFQQPSQLKPWMTGQPCPQGSQLEMLPPKMKRKSKFQPRFCFYFSKKKNMSMSYHHKFSWKYHLSIKHQNLIKIYLNKNQVYEMLKYCEIAYPNLSFLQATVAPSATPPWVTALVAPQPLLPPTRRKQPRRWVPALEPLRSAWNTVVSEAFYLQAKWI